MLFGYYFSSHLIYIIALDEKNHTSRKGFWGFLLPGFTKPLQ